MIARCATFLLVLFLSLSISEGQHPATLKGSVYRGWSTWCMANGLVELQAVPGIGGRIIQFSLGKKEFLWVNPALAGQSPTISGLGYDGGWLNYGGDKLWPAPQGWDSGEEWPGPPDAVLDGQPYEVSEEKAASGEAAIRLTSRKDPRSGIQFSRVIRIFEGSTRVSFDATMTNIDDKPRRWGIWAHTQLDAAGKGSAYNNLMKAWCPVNPRSKFPDGYSVIFGDPVNSSFQPDPGRGLMQVQYQYKVGKIGLDSHAGWSATVDGATGSVFVQWFVYEPDKEYPDGSSVEFWLNGTGTIHAYGKDLVQSDLPDENPYVFESEVLSPFALLKPGQSYTWHYDWFAANIGGDFPVVGCTDAGIVSEQLNVTIRSGMAALTGRFGVFAEGKMFIEFFDIDGHTVKTAPLGNVSPRTAVVIDTVLPSPAATVNARVILNDVAGRRTGCLSEAAPALNGALNK